MQIRKIRVRDLCGDFFGLASEENDSQFEDLAPFVRHLQRYLTPSH
jgi:hypothetical protein